MDDFQYHGELWGLQDRMVRSVERISGMRGLDPELAERVRLATIEGDSEARDDALADLFEAIAASLETPPAD